MPDENGSPYKMQQYNGKSRTPVNRCVTDRSKSVPLNELLDRIPLAYSPLTKQLHIIYPESENSASESCGESSKSCCMSNGDTECMPQTSHEVCEGKDTDFSSQPITDTKDLTPREDESYEEVSHEGSPVIESIKPKKRSISSFFSRNVFSWRFREHQGSSASGSGQGGNKISGEHAQDDSLGDDEVDSFTSCSLQQQDSPVSLRSATSKRYEDVIASSSALILHQRPANLPAKSADEEIKHRQEYEQMVEAAKRKERQEAKIRKKQLQQQIKTEERLANATKVWVNDILPKWNSVLTCRKTRNMWWQGIPPGVRGKVWQLAIGNELNVTQELYGICVSRAQELLRTKNSFCNSESSDEQDNPDRQASVELIKLDISRTFPQLCIFQKGGPYYDILHSLLGAYACYRPDIGYVQGMSFLAAVLILNMEEAQAFVCFANLLNRPCHMAFFRLDQSVMQAYYKVFEQLMAENLPKLYSHFMKSHLTPDLYLLDWIYTVFAKAMPLDIACRVWDVFLRDGEEFLFRTALGVLHLYQEQLIKLDFLAGAQFLTKLPDDLNADSLFHSIQGIRMQRYTELINSARPPSTLSASSSHCSTANNSGSNTPIDLS